MTFQLEIEGYGDYDYEPDFMEVIDALIIITKETKEYCFDNYEELVEDCYEELCEYFTDLKSDDIKDMSDTQDYLDWYYVYGRNM